MSGGWNRREINRDEQKCAIGTLEKDIDIESHEGSRN